MFRRRRVDNARHNIAEQSKEKQNKVNVDLAASGVAYRERLNIPVITEQVAREQPEHSREYFMERVRYYREQSLNLPKGSNHGISRWMNRTPRSKRNLNECDPAECGDFFYLNSLRRVLFYGDDKCTSESQVNGMESHSTGLSKQRTSTTAITTG
ncbi:DNA polymerase III subunit theta [Escherichia coli]|nr:DNA polymerase III subunit theta [Escherichia coli]EKQ5613373.1 DNA polymerase III subunit theta [Escherichia coli]